MVTKNRKVFYICLICMMIVNLGVIAVFYLINNKEVLPLENKKESERLIDDEDEMLLTEEQQQILKNTILEPEYR